MKIGEETTLEEANHLPRSPHIPPSSCPQSPRQVNFMVGGSAIRYRREIRPVFRQFEVHTFVARLDERHFWIYHTFRYPPGGKDPGRIRCAMVCQGLAVQGRTVLDPRKYLIENVGMDAETVEQMSQESPPLVHPRRQGTGSSLEPTSCASKH